VKRHDADATSLVFGLLFLALVAAWALGYTGLLQGRDLALLAPAALIGAGLIGLAVSLRRTRRPVQPDNGDDTLVLDNGEPHSTDGP